MTYSVERQLVNGVWETHVVDESGGGGGGVPDPLTTPLNIELAADAVALAVTAAPGGGANLLELTPDNPANALAVDSSGRLRAAAFAFIGSATAPSAFYLPDGSGFQISNDDTGDPIIDVGVGTPNTVDLNGDVSVNGVPYSGNGFPVVLADDEDVRISSEDDPTTVVRFVVTGSELAVEGTLANVSKWRLLSNGQFESQHAGPFLFPNAPEVPASPAVQDVVDALVALGLVTQAA